MGAEKEKSLPWRVHAIYDCIGKPIEEWLSDTAVITFAKRVSSFHPTLVDGTLFKLPASDIVNVADS